MFLRKRHTLPHVLTNNKTNDALNTAGDQERYGEIISRVWVLYRIVPNFLGKKKSYLIFYLLDIPLIDVSDRHAQRVSHTVHGYGKKKFDSKVCLHTLVINGDCDARVEDSSLIESRSYFVYYTINHYA